MSAELDYGTIITDLDEVGFHIIPSVIPVEKADEARAALEQLLEKETTAHALAEKTQRVGRIAVKHPIFLELMADTRVLDVIRVMCGDWLRLDHAYGIEMDSSWAGRENLHGGARTDQGEHQYQWHQG